MPSMALGLTSAGGIIGVKPHSAALRHRQLGERQLEPGAGAGEVVEPCAADLGAALGVDGAEQLAELQVVARLEALGREVARRADGVEDDEVVLAALGRLLRGGVGQRPQQRVERLGRLVLGGLGRLDLRAQRLGLGEQRLLLVALSACAICLPTVFCSARTDSNAAMDDRRRSSAATRSSTSSVGSPRRRWAARSASGSSRSSRGSITRSAYRPWQPGRPAGRSRSPTLDRPCRRPRE